VDRGKDKDDDTALLMGELRKEEGGRELDTVLANEAQKGVLAKRMDAYLAFASDFAPARREGRKAELFWVHSMDWKDRPGFRVRLAGLNTALLCAGDDDEGKLRLGKQQLQAALGDPPEKGELVIVLTHHPLRAWLEEGDARDAERWITSTAHVHLSGHVHEQETVQIRAGGARRGFVRVVAGAAHNERQPASWIPAGHGYNWAAVVDDGTGRLKLRIWPRSWSDSTRDFRLDTCRVQPGTTYAEHELSVTLAESAGKVSGATGSSPTTAAVPPTHATPQNPLPPASATPPAAIPAPAAKPVEVFYFYAPEDEDLAKRLDKHLALLRKSKTIASFDKQAIGAGVDVGSEAAARIESAGYFLVLLSASLIASDEFDGFEMTRALDRAGAGLARFIPIFLRPFDLRGNPIWETSRMQHYQGLPRAVDSDHIKWVASSADIEAELAAIAKALREQILGSARH
jgi:hypothetical protein